MTVSRRDVQAFSAGRRPNAPPIPNDEADRIAAVLNDNSIHRPAPPPSSPLSSVPVEPGMSIISVTESGRSADLVPDADLYQPRRQDSDPSTATQYPRRELLRLMQRVGYSSAQISDVRAQLPEVIDPHQHRTVLEKFGLTQAMFMERLGSSP